MTLVPVAKKKLEVLDSTVVGKEVLPPFWGQSKQPASAPGKKLVMFHDVTLKGTVGYLNEHLGDGCTRNRPVIFKNG